MSRVIFLIFFSFFSVSSFACREVVWDSGEWATNSNSAYVVRVIGISVPEMTNTPTTENNFGVKEGLLTSRMNKIVELVVHNTLKGNSVTDLKVLLKWCGGGQVQLGHAGVLFKLGNDWHIEHGASAIALAKQALTKQSN